MVESTSRMMGLFSLVSRSTVSLLAHVLFLEELELEPFRGILQHTLRALALLEDRLNRRPRTDGDLDRRTEQQRQLVDHRQIGGSDTTMTSARPSRRCGTKPYRSIRSAGIARNSS